MLRSEEIRLNLITETRIPHRNSMNILHKDDITSAIPVVFLDCPFLHLSHLHLAPADLLTLESFPNLINFGLLFFLLFFDVCLKIIKFWLDTSC